MDNFKYKVLANLQGNSSMKLLYGYILDNGLEEITVSPRKLGKEVGMTKSANNINNDRRLYLWIEKIQLKRSVGLNPMNKDV